MSTRRRTGGGARRPEEGRGQAPLVLYRGDENPLLPLLLRFEPGAAALADRTMWAGIRPAVEGEEWTTPADVIDETQPETPGGLDVAFELAEVLASHDGLRRELAGRDTFFGDGYTQDFGYHTDADVDACESALASRRPVLRWADLVRRFASPPPRAPERTRVELRGAGEPRDGEPHDATAGAAIRELERQIAVGGSLPPIRDAGAQGRVAGLLGGADLLAWNELDWELALALADGGALATLDGLVDTSDGSTDRHGRLRSRLEVHGAREHALLVAALSSWSYGARFTGRELWVLSREPGALAAALLEVQGTHPERPGRVLQGLASELEDLGDAVPRARAVWRSVQPSASEASVVAMLRSDPALFSSWVAPHADAYGAGVQALLV